MATVNQARVRRVDRFENGSALLHLQMEEPAQLPHIPGQYVIVNSELSYPNGKAGKRAYSLFGADREARTFHLAAERIEGGLVSSFLNDRNVDDLIPFSGPWGKFRAPEEGFEKPVLGVAFATGITALLGLLGLHELPADSRLIWVRDASAHFLPDNCIKDLLPRSLSRFDIVDSRSADPDLHVFGLCGEELGRSPQIYAAGEGQSIDLLEQRLNALGHVVQKESFFRRPAPLS